MTAIAPGPARRALDILAGGLGLLLTALPLLLLMLAVRWSSRGPALFAQVRVGESGQPFVMYKLRTMRVDSVGPEVTAAEDPRVTPLGRFLRRTSLDELPQLWNVLRGDMTLVGPRPETPGLAARYPADCQWIFQYRPGLTGPSQVRLRDAQVLRDATIMDEETYLSRLVRARTTVDATFLQHPTIAATLSVLADTVRHLLGRPTRPVASPEAGIGR